MAAPSADALCAVCLCDIVDASERATLLECAHAFCRACIAGWASRGARACPLCRTAFSGWRAGGEDAFVLPTAQMASALREAALADYRASALRPPAPATRRDVPRPRAAQPTAYFARLRRTVLSSSAATPAWGAAPPAAAPDAALARRAAVYVARVRATPPPRRRGAPAAPRSRTELRNWLERDLRALLRTDDVALLCHFALSLFLHAQDAPPGAGDAAGDTSAVTQLAPYLGEAAAALLWHELRCFSSSHLNMAAYDAAVSYESYRGARQAAAAVAPSTQRAAERRGREPASRSPQRQRSRGRRRRRSRSKSVSPYSVELRTEEDDGGDGGRWSMQGAEHAAPPPRLVARTRR